MKLLVVLFSFLSLYSSAADRLILCGWDEVFMIDPSATPTAKTWSWKAENHAEIPPEVAKTFGSADLVFSTDRHVWLFDRDKSTIRPHPELADLALVKGIDIHPKSGRVILIKATAENWWSDSINLFHPAATLKLEGEHLYKGRWMIEP